MPGELPKGWTAARFRNVMRLEERREPIDPTRVYKLLGVRWYGKGAFLREERLGQGLSAQHIYRVQPGDVIYNRLFAWKGSFGLVGDDLADCHVSNEFPLFAACLDKVDPQFLLHILQHPRTSERADAFSTGTTSISRNRLGEDDFLQFPLNLPPVAEQRAIAEVLGAVEDAIDKTEASIKATTQTLHKTIDWVLGRAKSASAPIVNLGQVIESTKYGTSAKCGDDRSGFPVLRIPNVLSHGVDQGDLKYADLPPDEAKKFELRDGDLLAVRTNGNPEYVGRMALIKGLPTSTLYASYLIRIRVDQKKVLPEFVWLCSETFPLRDSLTAAATTSAGNFNINSDGLKSARLPLPNIDIQKQVVDAAEILRFRRLREQEYLERLRNTHTSLAQELLSGRLRLPESMIARRRDNPERAA